MTKPKWLVDREAKAHKKKNVPDMCVDCINYGPTVKYTRHVGEGWTEVHRCILHPACLNTEYSICCEDFKAKELV